MKDCIEISKRMYEGNYEELTQNRMINREMILIAGAFTHTDIKEEDLPEGDEINMCKAMDQLFQKFEKQGMERGKYEEKQNTLKEQLKVKFGNLSGNLEEKLTNTLLEKLNELTLNIFNINSEEEVLKIIN
jgi:hypothetical protein